MVKEEKDNLIYESMGNAHFNNSSMDKPQPKSKTNIHNREESFPMLATEDFVAIAPDEKKAKEIIVTKNDRYLKRLCKPLRRKDEKADKSNDMFRKKFSQDNDGAGGRIKKERSSAKKIGKK